MDDDYSFILPGQTVSKAALQQRFDQHERQRGAVSILEYISDREDRDAIRAGTSLADLTPIFDLATQQIHDAGGGTLFMPAGLYHGTMALTRSGVSRCNISGDYGGTLMRAAKDGAFAITLSANHFAPEPFTYPVIQNIGILGDDGSIAKRRCGLFLPRRANLYNVSFFRCLIGIAAIDHYYGAWYDLNFKDCDVGLFMGTLSTGNETITDLIDGAEAPTQVTLPEAGWKNGTGHSGNRLLVHTRINGGRVGIMLAGETIVPHTKIVKPTIESCTTAIANLAGRLTISSGWFEQNTQGSGPIEVNGQTIQPADIYSRGVGGLRPHTVLKEDCRLENIYADTYSAITVESAIIYEHIRKNHGSISLREVIADNRAYRETIERPIPERRRRSIQCYTQTKSIKVFHQPANGRVLVADDLQGSSFRSKKLRATTGADLTWEVDGGIFPNQKCMRFVMVNEEGFDVNVAEEISEHKSYVYIISIYVDVEINIHFPGASYFIFPVTGSHLIVPAHKWTSICIHTQAMDRNGATAPLRLRALGIESHAIVRWSGFQLLEFDGPLEAADALVLPYFYGVEN